MERKNFATFRDGHAEDVVYYQEHESDRITLFATKSGIYLSNDQAPPEGVAGVYKVSNFFRVVPQRASPYVTIVADPGVSSLVLDKRVEYDYHVQIGDVGVCGKILVGQYATEQEIQCEILKEAGLKIEFERTEED